MAINKRELQKFLRNFGLLDDNNLPTAGVSTSGVTVGAPVSPIDGDAWMEVSGVSPNRSAALKYRDGGTTITLVQVNF
jgi:hypothetical protein